MAMIQQAANTQPKYQQSSIVRAADGLEPAPLAEYFNIPRFHHTLAFMESSGGKFKTEGGSGKFTIRQGELDEYNKATKEKLTLADVADPEISEKVLNQRVAYYLSKDPLLTEPQMAAIWHYGWKGYHDPKNADKVKADIVKYIDNAQPTID